MMVFRYGFGVDIEAAARTGLLALTPKDLIAGVNLSTIILIVHGWFYVALRRRRLRAVAHARGGPSRASCSSRSAASCPITSFFFERLVPRWAEEAIARTEHPKVVAA